jgi:hypothetical protein
MADEIDLANYSKHITFLNERLARDDPEYARQMSALGNPDPANWCPYGTGFIAREGLLLTNDEFDPSKLAEDGLVADVGPLPNIEFHAVTDEAGIAEFRAQVELARKNGTLGTRR